MPIMDRLSDGTEVPAGTVSRFVARYCRRHEHELPPDFEYDDVVAIYMRRHARAQAQARAAAQAAADAAAAAATALVASRVTPPPPPPNDHPDGPGPDHEVETHDESD
eukprot:10830952-Alexandrium_andersonii.AAC.1